MLLPASLLATLGWVLPGHGGRGDVQGRGPTMLCNYGVSPKAFAHISLSNPPSYIFLIVQLGLSFLPSLHYGVLRSSFCCQLNSCHA